MKALSIMLKPIHRGWAVQLTDGRELARFLGPGSRWRALRYAARATGQRRASRPRPSFPAWSGAGR
jgi:hypothetical protein